MLFRKTSVNVPLYSKVGAARKGVPCNSELQTKSILDGSCMVHASQWSEYFELARTLTTCVYACPDSKELSLEANVRPCRT